MVAPSSSEDAGSTSVPTPLPKQQYGDGSDTACHDKKSLDFIAPGIQRLSSREGPSPNCINRSQNNTRDRHGILHKRPCTSDRPDIKTQISHLHDGEVSNTSATGYRPVLRYCRIAPVRKGHSVDIDYATRPHDPYNTIVRFYNRDNADLRPSTLPKANLVRRVSYGEDERAFIMVCKILGGMKWHDIELEFSAWFPPGQRRRNQGAGLPPFYPPKARIARDPLQLYYCTRMQWGLPRVMTVSNEEKRRIRAFVAGKIQRMYHLPEIMNFAHLYKT